MTSPQCIMKMHIAPWDNLNAILRYINLSHQEKLKFGFWTVIAKHIQEYVHACITSVLDQNNNLLFGKPINPINTLQRIQNVSEKLICKIQLIIYKTLNGCGTTYLQDLLHFYIPNHELRSENYDLLYVMLCDTHMTCVGHLYYTLMILLWCSYDIQ